MRRYGVLVVPLALVTWLLTGCGNMVTTEVIGVAALTQGSDGSPVLLVKVCRDHIDTLSVFASRRGLAADQPNPMLASWTSDQPVSGTIRFPIEQPPSGWDPGRSTPADFGFKPSGRYIVLGQASDEDAEVIQVSFSGRALRELRPGQVLIRNSQIWSDRRFDRQACSLTE